MVIRSRDESISSFPIVEKVFRMRVRDFQKRQLQLKL